MNFSRVLRKQSVDFSITHAGETFSGLRKPKRTPNHPRKSHAVLIKKNGKYRIIRFGDPNADTAGKPKEGESDHMKKKRKSFKARHRKGIAKGETSGSYWSNRVKW